MYAIYCETHAIIPEVTNIFASYGFVRNSWVLFVAEQNMTAVDCVVAVQDMAKKYQWLVPAIKEIKLLRIEESSDLFPAIQKEIIAPQNLETINIVDGKYGVFPSIPPFVETTDGKYATFPRFTKMYDGINTTAPLFMTEY